MPEVRAIQVERPLVVREQIPGIAREVLIHSLGRDHLFGRIELRRAILLVANATDLFEVRPEIGAKQVMQGVNALI